VKTFCGLFFHHSNLEEIDWEAAANSIRIALGYGGSFESTKVVTAVYAVDALGREHEIEVGRITYGVGGKT
jgi:hypothetical protein